MNSFFTFLRVVVCVWIMFVYTSCKNNNEEKLSEYYYYPSTNMYFDVAKNNYIFSLDGSKTWDTIDATTQNEGVALGEKLVIKAWPDSLLINNEVHRKTYGGLLYDVLDGDTSEVSATEVVTEKVVKAKPLKKEGEEKPKKGLGKFLSKIFGKKNKNKKDQ